MRSLLLGDSESCSTSAGRLGFLTSDLESEVVTETSVLTDLLHALQVFSESSVDHVGDQLRPGTILDASLSVEEPFGNAVICWLSENVTNSVHFFFSELSCSAVQVNLSNFAYQGAETTTNTLDNSESERDFVFAIHVRVLHSENVLEIVSFLQDKCRLNKTTISTC